MANRSIDDVLNDQDFLSLPEEEQNAFIDEMRQRDFGKIPNSTSFLDRALKSFMPTKKSPVQMAQDLVPGMNQMWRGEDMANNIAETATDNPIGQAGMNIAANMMVPSGAIAKGAKSGFKSIMNPSKAFGEGIVKAQASKPKAAVKLARVISDGMDDPVARKIIEKSGVLEKFGGSSLDESGMLIDNLENLDLQKSQDLINALKSSVRLAVREGTVKPTEIGISKMLGGIVKAQDEIFPSFAGVRKSYGFAKKTRKALKSTAKTAATGAVLGAGGTVVHSFIKSFLNK